MRSHGDRLGQRIPPLHSLEDTIDERVASGEREEAATLAVVEDFERSAATVNARITPLVPASGIVITGAGILTRESDAVAAVSYLAMSLALGGLGFLATALLTHAGRPSVGLAPTRADIAFVHARLIKKEASGRVGSVLTALGFVVLLLIISPLIGLAIAVVILVITRQSRRTRGPSPE
jgi:hypothetical protein